MLQQRATLLQEDPELCSLPHHWQISHTDLVNRSLLAVNSFTAALYRVRCKNNAVIFQRQLYMNFSESRQIVFFILTLQPAVPVLQMGIDGMGTL